MEIKKYVDASGKMWRGIVSWNYWRLRELEAEYKKCGALTSFSLFDSCNGKWILTVVDRMK